MILIDVFKTFRQIIVITNTVDYSSFIADVCIRVRTELRGIAVSDGSVCSNDRLTVFRIFHFCMAFVQVF